MTELVNGQKPLLADEQSFRLLVDGVTDCAIYLLDIDGKVASWNSGAQRIKQYAANEILGQSFELFYTEDDRRDQLPQRGLQQARETGRFETCGWRLRKDGSRFMAEVVIQPVCNDAGTLIGYAKITRDVTERSRNAEKLREASSLKAVVTTALDGVLIYDDNGAIRLANPACHLLFGFDAGEIYAQHIDDLIPGRQQGSAELTGQRKDGTRFPLSLSVGEARQDGEIIHVGIVHDLTERKRLEAQLVEARKMEAVGQLSGGVAHDFNNLLTVMMGNAELLGEALRSKPELQHLCDMIVAAGERGAELTRSLLAFGRRQTLQPVAVDCGSLLAELQPVFQHSLGNAIALDLVIEPQLAAAKADPAQLRTSLISLVANARDAMPRSGNLKITVGNASLDASFRHKYPEVRPGSYVMIALTDDGTGMSAADCARAFEPFFTTREVGQGTGLGLSMVYGFVKQSGGHLAVYSEPHLGTTVRLYLPVAAAPANRLPAALPPPTPYDSAMASLTGIETVLVAEDDPFSLTHLVGALRSLGYNVVTATDGPAAMALLAQDCSIDILLADILIPGMGGWELATQARQICSELKILLTTDHGLETLIARGRYNPLLPLLPKPCSKTELAHRLRELVGAPENIISDQVLALASSMCI